jgi:uncharacterized cupin superfamily protein
MAQVLHCRSTHSTHHQHGPGYEVGHNEGTQACRIDSFDAVLLGIVEAGALGLSGEGFALHLGPGECFVVPKGVTVDWQPEGNLRYRFIRFAGLEGVASHDRPLKLDLYGPLLPCDPPATEVLLSATPQAWSQAAFEQGALRIGVWACEPYQRRQVEPGYSELMHIIDGQLTLTEADGTAHTAAAGETLVVPAGATNAWASQTRVRKVYCILG